MSTENNMTDLLKNYTSEELVKFFGENMLIGSGAIELAKASVIGKNMGISIAAELLPLLKNPDSGISFIEPYGNSLMKFEKDSKEYKQALNDLGMILNQNDISVAVDLLKTRGICLSGKAGIGKGVLANNIGAGIVEANQSYNSYANLVVSCASSINPNNVSWGTGMNNVEVLGAVYTASKYAKENPNTAVVLVLDELFDCDWKSVLGKALEFFSDKTRGTSSIMTNGEMIKYESNLFVVVTGNSGEGFNRSIDDERFKTRFVNVPLSGLFQSKDTIMSYSRYMSVLTDNKEKIESFINVLFNILDVLDDIGNDNLDRTVSLRALNNLVVTLDSEEAFESAVHSLFSQTDRKALGWNDSK